MNMIHELPTHLLPQHLMPSKYIDCENASIVEEAVSITKALYSDRSKALAIYDFVKNHIEYQMSPLNAKIKASRTLELRKGDSIAKSTLFIALLRASGIPAKQIFALLDARIYDGIAHFCQKQILHAYAETYIQSLWLKCDSYTIDFNLYQSASNLLLLKNKSFGYGISLTGECEWDGKRDSMLQFGSLENDSEPENWNKYCDIDEFCRGNRKDNRRLLDEFKHRLFLRSINRKIYLVRKGYYLSR